MLQQCKYSSLFAYAGGHFSSQQHLGGFDVAAARAVGQGQRGAEPGGLREERPALLPIAAPH